MSFSLIPPEINSALMLSGAGSGPLLEASAAWNSLAADLESTATQYQTLVTNLVTGSWLGPSSAQMASATAPYIAWLQGSAATAAQTGAQAQVAAAAYQTAYASMVPLPEIAANRALLAELVSNNFLGQNTGAIATTEANYLDMWIQDALGMDTYQVNSQAATALPAQVAAPQVASGAAPAAAVAAAIVRRPFTQEPMTSLRRVRVSSAIIGTGRMRLSTTWLRTSAWVASNPTATIAKEGTIVTSRRSQSGMRNPTKPCMMTCPAIVPTAELDNPEAISDTKNTPAAPEPRTGIKVR